MLTRNRAFIHLITRIFAFLFAILLPILLHGDSFSRLVTNFHGEDFELLELFGFSATIGLFMWAFIEIRLNRITSWKGQLPVWLTVFIGLVWLSILVETSSTPGDYPCYQNAAMALHRNKSPYHGCYFYPPLLAQAMASLSETMIFLTGLVGKKITPIATWPLVFYFFQCIQLLLILASFRLSLALAQELKLKRIFFLPVITGLFTLNTPLLRTVILHQVNLWILVSVLGILLLVYKRPFWTGIITAFSGHLKVYPLIFAIPFAIRKNWLALVGLAAGLVALVVIPISLGHRISIWLKFIQFFPRFPQYNAPRNDSLYSIVANLLVLAGADVTNVESLWRLAPRLGYSLLVILMIAWLAWRFFYNSRISNISELNDKQRRLQVDYSLLMDMVAAQLLVSPSLWEHQWVIIIPFVLWAFSFQFHLSRRPNLLAVSAATIMIYAIPSFDVIPFSYIRITGLFILLWITNPVLVYSRNQSAPQ